MPDLIQECRPCARGCGDGCVGVCSLFVLLYTPSQVLRKGRPSRRWTSAKLTRDCRAGSPSPQAAGDCPLLPARAPPDRVALMPATALACALSCKPCSSARGALSCPLARTAFEIFKVLAHLFERKSQSEEAFGQLRIEVAREALPAEFVDHRRIGLEGGFDSIPWRWSAPAAKRIGNAADVVGNGGCSVIDRDFQAQPESFWRWQLCGSADHHQVVTQPQERPHERRCVRFRGKACCALVLSLCADDTQMDEGLADAILQAVQSLGIHPLCQAREQGAQCPRHVLERARRRLDCLLVRTGGQQKD